MREKVDYMHIILRGGLLAMVCALLSVVWVNDPMLPAGENCSVRGIGVADMVSVSTLVFSLRSFSFVATPYSASLRNFLAFLLLK